MSRQAPWSHITEASGFQRQLRPTPSSAADSLPSNITGLCAWSVLQANRPPPPRPSARRRGTTGHGEKVIRALGNSGRNTQEA